MIDNRVGDAERGRAMCASSKREREKQKRRKRRNVKGKERYIKLCRKKYEKKRVCVSTDRNVQVYYFFADFERRFALRNL